MEKILTIIVPTYNMEKYLDKCLTSIIIDDKELMHRLEVIVVIDGAKDRSSEIAHSYQQKYPNVFLVIDKENGNYGSCINTGLKAATGHYIRILDADDSVNTMELQILLENILNLSQDVDMICTNYAVYDEKDTLSAIHQFKNIPYDEILNLSDIDFWKSGQPHMVAMHTITYRTNLLVEISYSQQTGISYTDTEYVFIPMMYAKKVIFFNLTLYRYLVGRVGQTVSISPTKDRTEQYFRVAYRLLNLYKSKYDTLPKSKIHNLRCCLRNPIISFFFYSLVFIPKDKETNDRMLLLKDIIKSVDTEFWSYLLEQKQHHVPYIKIWDVTGLFLSESSIFNFMLSLKQKLIKLCSY